MVPDICTQFAIVSGNVPVSKDRPLCRRKREPLRTVPPQGAVKNLHWHQSPGDGITWIALVEINKLFPRSIGFI